MPEKMIIRKLDTRVEKAPAPRSFDFIISNGRQDRDGDVVNPLGWDLTAYRASPVVLWAHDHKIPPIARATDIGVVGQTLRARAEFPPVGIYPFADQVHDLVKNGFLNAVSVGFLPIKRSATGYDAQELLEFSLVSVPSNPEALVQLRSWLGQTRPTIPDAGLYLEIIGPMPRSVSVADARWRAHGLAPHVVDRPLVAHAPETFDVDLAVVGAAVRETFKAFVQDVAARQIRTAMTALTGRLD